MSLEKFFYREGDRWVVVCHVCGAKAYYNRKPKPLLCERGLPHCVECGRHEFDVKRRRVVVRCSRG